MSIATLSVDEVVRIHYVLCQDFVDAEDPIGYGGVKSQPLLESAVGRQHPGFGPFRKYATPVVNAATLTFGICCDHPFHNGNKRTALVAMLAHLDKNRLTLKGTVRQNELYEMMLALADRRLTSVRIPPRTRRRVGSTRYDADHQVQALEEWLVGRVESVRRGEQQLTFRQLRTVLRTHGYELEADAGNKADVIRIVTKKRGLLRREPSLERQRVGTIGHHSGGQQVSIKDIKHVRKITKLTEEHGCDSAAFYEGADMVDTFVNRYRTVLRRLART